MYLAHPNKDRPSCWEVAWTWLPYFLAADSSLIHHVDAELTAKFKSRVFDAYSTEDLKKEIHEEVIKLILERYPIKGLREYLSSVEAVDKAG